MPWTEIGSVERLKPLRSSVPPLISVPRVELVPSATVEPAFSVPPVMEARELLPIEPVT